MGANRFFASTLTHPFCIVLSIVLACASFYVRMEMLGVYLCFLSLFLLVAKRWSKSALRGISVSICCSASEIYADNTVRMEYTVENNKLMPIIWLDVWQDIPQRDFLVPDDTIQKIEVDRKEKEVFYKYQIRFSFLHWYTKTRLESVWQAKKRGIYLTDTVTLRSGDGFGFTATERIEKLAKPLMITVYPRRVPVNTEWFYQLANDESYGSRGLLEDISVLKSIRPYEETDTWKKINWRMAARQETLVTNVYERIMPRTLHFLLDVSSFYPEQEEAFEETLEILSSLMREISQDGILCGLSLPATKAAQAKNIWTQGGDENREILQHLAAISCDTPEGVFDEEEIFNRRAEAGELYYVAYNTAGITSPGLVERLKGRASVVLYSEDGSAGAFLNQALHVRQFLRKDGSNV